LVFLLGLPSREIERHGLGIVWKAYLVRYFTIFGDALLRKNETPHPQPLSRKGARGG